MNKERFLLSFRSIQLVSFTVATFVGFMLLAVIVLGKISPLYYLLALLVVPALVYLFTNVVFRFYVINRIKPIYQILTRRESSSEEIDKKYTGKDIVNQLDSDIMIWAQQSEDELKRLRIMERYRKEFIGNVSHELKTPIFSIQGYILTLMDGGIDDPQINYQYLAKTEKNIDRLINIITNLEEIANLESGVLELFKKRFDIIELIEEIIEHPQFSKNDKGIKISLKNEISEKIDVYADRSRIEQVLTNLISNSIKYGIDEGRTTIHFVDVFDHILIEVKDNGIGISSDALPRVFERFYRADKGRARSVGGSGLGLAIVKHIIEAHNESITARSYLGEGSTFSFTLKKG